MFNGLPPLTSLRAFESAVRLGAFNLAAEELNVTPAAVGAQIRSLEAWLGYALFERRNRRAVPTANALRLQQACNSGFSTIQEGIASYVAEGDSLTVGVGSLFASRWLSPRLSDFWIMHPSISLRLIHSPVIQDSLPRGFDAAIVWGRGNWPNVSSHCILQPSLVPVASPDYIAKHGRPERISDLSGHSLVQEQGSHLWRAWFEAMNCEAVGDIRGTSAGDGAVAMQLALDGQGICLGVQEFIEDDLLDDRLMALFPPTTVSDLAYYLVSKSEKRPDAPVERFTGWITQISAGTPSDMR